MPRVTKTQVQVHYADATMQRVTRVQGSVHYADRTNPVRASRVQVSVHYADRTLPVRVTRLFLQVHMDTTQVLEFGFTESSAEFFPASIDQTQELIPEFNPYRPTVPEEYSDISSTLYEFQREDTEIKRQQHNLIQAGDTTFPWQMLTQLNTEKFYTLGSLGRFYHPDFGIILARYVRFELMTIPTSAAPVGRLLQSKAVDWVVTNKYGESHPDLVVGVIASYEPPSNGTFGWVIVNGACLATVTNLSQGHETGEAFSWAETGAVSADATGRVLGRRVGRQNTKSLISGVFCVEVESWSAAALRILFAEDFDQISVELGLINTRVTELENTNVAVAGIQTSLNALQTRLIREENRRAQADAGIIARINAGGGVTGAQLSAAVTNLINMIQVGDDNLSVRITAAQARADAAYALAAGIVAPDLTPIYNSLSDILTRLGDIQAQPRGFLPLVDGSVPPNLMYLDDGSLVYVEVY